MRRLLIAAVLMVAACGSPRDERSVSADPVPRVGHDDILFARSLDASCAALASARCADFVLCASFADRAHFRDEPECVANVTRSCVEHGNMPGINGAIERADECARSLRALDCHDRRDPDAQLRACSVPGNPPLGTLADGAPCVDGAQCAGGACVREDGKRCGSCARAPALGTACATNADCGLAELYCTSNRCAARRDIDGACDSDGDCRNNLACIRGLCAVGTMGEGEVCIAGSNACDPRQALRCIGEEWTRCVRYEVIATAESCVGAAMGLPVMCGGAGAYCRATDWRCVSPTAFGGACATDAECGADGACVQLDGRAICIPMAEVCR